MTVDGGGRQSGGGNGKEGEYLSFYRTIQKLVLGILLLVCCFTALVHLGKSILEGVDEVGGFLICICSLSIILYLCSTLTNPLHCVNYI